jgi:hypothetical protein
MSRPYIKRIELLEANASPVNLGGLQASAVELNRVAKVSTRLVTANQSTLAVTEALHDSKTVLLDRAAGIAVTLPVATGGGARYRFVVKTAASGGSYVLRGGASDVLRGNAIQFADGGNTVNGYEAGASDDTVTLNGTTTGGLAGDVVEFEDIAANVYAVSVNAAATGVEASPFSNT